MQHGSVRTLRRDNQQISRRSSLGAGFASNHASRTNSVMTEVTPLLNGSGEKLVTPLPRLPMAILALAIFSEPVSSTILLPFIYFMVRDFHVAEDEKAIGFYAGTIASAYFLAQFVTSIPWGSLSDRYGRRPVLLIGLIGNTITMIMFGLSPNLAIAVLSRCLCGALNGNVGVSKSVLGEITDSTNQPMAFAMFGFCWGVGGIAGPVLGGLLANPATQFPDVFGGIELFKRFPYFLPCAVSAVISIIGLFMTYFFFEETNPAVIHQDDYSRPPSISDSLLSVMNSKLTQTLSNMFGNVDAYPRRFSIAGNDHIAGVEIQPQESFYKQMFEEYGSSVATNSNSMAELVTGFGMVQPVMDLPEMVRTITQSTVTGNGNYHPDAEYHAHYGEINPNNIEEAMKYFVVTETESETIVSKAVPEEEVAGLVEGQQSLVSEWREDGEGVPDEVRTVVLMLPENMPDPGQEKKRWSLGLGISKLSGDVIISYTLFAVALPEIGGLGWNSPDLAISLALMGLVQLVAQFVLYPMINARVSTMTLYRWSSMMYIPLYMTCPIISHYGDVWGAEGDRWIWYFMLLNLTIRFTLSTFSYTAVMLMVNNSAPVESLGTVNGVAQMSVSFVRGIGPALGGSLWSFSLTSGMGFPFNYFFVFIFMSFISLLNFLSTWPIPAWVGEARDGAAVMHMG
ncbi:hypothetical protein INT43_002779 [Umbelopsis isabellina]|uniref:Major facilitator superfamily (MFS) profile domain-containing protein n=1 Tax=Mortierella isabellina TaxID=91625 RepID=A0A8H7Q5T4_MORIS|nr:hypothetical protein INT43_002779 [Umbelopsis isabellina]